MEGATATARAGSVMRNTACLRVNWNLPTTENQWLNAVNMCWKRTDSVMLIETTAPSVETVMSSIYGITIW